MTSTSAPNVIEAAEWTFEGPTRFSDAAIDALVQLGFDLVEADGVDIGDGTEALPNE